MSPDRLFLFVGSVSAMVSVAAGAFGAHVLATSLPAAARATFDTAVDYQAMHALALCVVAWSHGRWQGRALASLAGAFFVAGTLLFCGSLYVVALAGVAGVAVLAPFGGASFIAGWLCLAVLALGATRRV